MSDTGSGGVRLQQEIDRNWLWLTLIAWAAATIWFVYQDWGHIRWLALGDTDDNMRLMQVRALLHGQGWYDLRQYRLDPPGGFDIHWSRLVDLPIAGLILLLRPFTSEFWAERIACGLAPLLPMAIAMVGLSFTARKLISPLAWPLALIIFLLGAPATLPMFLPMRIDHHGWQLAMLSLTVAGLADPKRTRGGAIIGISSAVSLTIGLELLPFAAMAGAIVALRWIWDRTSAPRMTVYALTLAAGSTLGFALFASNANQALRCDALTPVWLSVMIAAGLLLFLLARFNPEQRWLRLTLALVAGAVIVAGFAAIFPQCLGRPEQVSPELAKSWLDNVREAKPIYQQPMRMRFPLAVMPIIGLICTAIATWRARGGERFVAWVAVLLFAIFAAGMMFWQVRAGPAAQLLAVPGATAIGWIILPWFRRQQSLLLRVIGPVVGFIAISGLFAGLVMRFVPIDPPNAREKIVNRASRYCPTLPALAPLDRLPSQVIFTFVDLGPRLITVTHHDAVAGPYHRNGDAILDVQHAFQGSPALFHAIARRHHATLLLTCPNMAESTVYRARAPGGFYDRLAQGEVPAWLTPMPLPKNSPLKLWRID